MRKEKTVMAFGSFDLLHPGHLLYLRRARALGDRLIVVVARDESIEMLKRRKPLLNERARLSVIRSLRMVDLAVLGNRLSNARDRYRILEKYRPSVIAFGYDQRVNEGEVKKWLMAHGIKARIVRIRVSEDPRIFKSSRLKTSNNL